MAHIKKLCVKVVKLMQTNIVMLQIQIASKLFRG